MQYESKMKGEDTMPGSAARRAARRLSRDKRVFRFGHSLAEGTGDMRNELGGKGASMMVMNRLGLPVPPGFTISTQVCNEYFQNKGELSESLKEEAEEAMKLTEELVGRRFGDPKKPLLVSCRSGARQSMPGMMDTVLNVGLTTETIPGLLAQTGNEWFVYDTYRRLIMMYSDIVLEKAAGIEPEEGKGIRDQLEDILEKKKKDVGCEEDTCLSIEDQKWLCDQFKKRVKKVLNKKFPDDPYEQLWSAIGGVFKSWWGKRAVAYRRIEGIPDEWGTACTVQAMVFGNMGNESATGVAFTRNPATGDNIFYGECLFNAQGEDVVAGIRTPNPLNETSKTEQNQHLPTLEEEMPEVYRELLDIRRTLELHSKDMLDIEFTIEEGKLFMVQYRVGKRTATAALNIAMDMLNEGLIDIPTTALRVKPDQVSQLLYPIVDPDTERNAKPIAKGLPAGPGGAVGQIVFTPQDAIDWTKKGKQVILVRDETSPEDIEGMRAAVGILTARGGMTSHAALVTRGWGKCCIVGAGMLKLDINSRTMTIDNRTFIEGSKITLNGTEGLVYEGELPLKKGSENPRLQEYLDLVDEYRVMGLRTNVDTPEDAQLALQFGAEGIGLFRTEHMFYGAGADKPLLHLRRMILADNEKERREALEKLEPFVKANIKATLEVMGGYPVTIRLLDPPLHEFVPQSKVGQEKLAQELKIDVVKVRNRGDALREINPMMGMRGVRLGIAYPEIPEMQVRAIFEAAAELLKEDKEVRLEIMIPVTIGAQELRIMRRLVDKVYEEIRNKYDLDIDYLFGTMIEIPRACVRANDMAEVAEFFSFGTNDLSQMSFGFSRDDFDTFLPIYLENGILSEDPFASIDLRGIGELIKIAIERGRTTRAELKLGVCGEHAGDPSSIEFFHQVGIDYISCSPYRLPIARVAAAQAALKDKISRRQV